MNADALNAILDEIARRVAVALNLPADRIYEYRGSGEKAGEAAYFQASIADRSPLGCAYDCRVECAIGFMKADDGTPRRIQRTKWSMALVEALSWGPFSQTQPIPGANFPDVSRIDLTETGNPDRGHLMGGIVYNFRIVVQDV